MNYIHTEANGQLTFSDKRYTFLTIPAALDGFNNTDTDCHRSYSNRDVICFNGTLDITEDDRKCPECGGHMHVNCYNKGKMIRHLCFGKSLSCLCFDHAQLICPSCGATRMQNIPFKAKNHKITNELLRYTCDLLALGTFTLKDIAYITGLGKNTVKDIDLERLKGLYTIDGEKLIKPEKQARILGIDEFKLHDGHRYATHIIDLESGHVLWVSHGKKKQVVYDFIEHVGLEWMDGVEVVACDMNSDFEEAFKDKCPHIQPVFDHFHIIKNFNDKVVSEVRKDEQRRLLDEGLDDEAAALKKTKYILMSNRSTLQKKDKEARDSKVISKSGKIFPKEEYVRKEGYEARYNELLSQNQLLFTLDLIKEKLALAYSRDDEDLMTRDISGIMETCEASGNQHLQWFGRLLSNHFEGIIAHATYKVSSGKIEGINNKIKTLRRQHYGLPDDDYFFLKLFDITRKGYVRNVPSHRVCD